MDDNNNEHDNHDNEQWTLTMDNDNNDNGQW